VSQTASILKYGGAGILGAVVLAAGGLGAVAWMQLGGEELKPARFAQAPVRTLAVDGKPSRPLPMQVLVDIKDADVGILPGPAGSPLRVEASFDPRYFALEQRPGPDGDAERSLHVWFRRVGGGGSAMHMIRELLGAERSEVRLFLPRDLEVSLHLDIAGSVTRMDLADLWVDELTAEVSMAGLDIDVSGPTRPMTRIDIDSRQATVRLGSLGNASPREIAIETTMGGGEIDLRGEWVRDADVRLEAKMAGGSIWLPDDVDVLGLEGAVTGLVVEESPRPTLRFDAESEMGRFGVVR
jgi:hypothetical protein